MRINERALDLIQESLFNAMISEVSVTPKPGLVDRGPLSAHRDMDFFSFVSSSAAIAPYFRQMAQLPLLAPADNPLTHFAKARRIGIEAEKAMLRATKGVNTQKGIIFLGGFLSLALGLMVACDIPVSEEALRHLTIRLSAALQDDLSNPQGQTHGEILHQRYQTRGIRGEVEMGLPCVFDVGLPALRQALSRGLSYNDAGLESLLSIMAHCEDTTVLWRHGPQGLAEVQQVARAYLNQGGTLGDPGFERLKALDIQFSQRGISPGGAADLLFMTFAVYQSLPLLAEIQAANRVEERE